MAKQLRRDIRSLLAVPQHVLTSEINERLGKLGFPQLRPPQAQLLMLVEPGGLRLTSLVDAMGLPKQTLGDMIDDLETMKLVERYPDPEHGVIKRVRLGSKGRTWAAEVRKIADTSEDRWSRALGKTKMKSLRGLLEELAGSIENGAGEALPASTSNGVGKK
jgi:DNA-binding MarR family transcriptional regulator